MRILKNVNEPITNTLKNTSEDMTKTMMLTSKENNKALENLNTKFLEIQNDRSIIASHLMSPLSKITNLENTNQFKLAKDSNSKRVIDLLKRNTIPVILYFDISWYR